MILEKLMSTVDSDLPNVESLSTAIEAALEESVNYDNPYGYTEYESDEDFGESGNRVESAAIVEAIEWNPETNEFLIPVDIVYGHGSKYDASEWITDDETIYVHVDENGQARIIDYTEMPGFILLDDTEELACLMDGIETTADFS